MAVVSGQVSVPNTAGGTVIVPAANASWNAGQEDNAPSRFAVLTNAATAAVFLGTSGVTTSTGYSLAASATVSLWLHPDEAIYGIVATTSSTVSFVESGS